MANVLAAHPYVASATSPRTLDTGATRAAHVEHAPSAVACLRMFASLAWLSSALVGKDAKLATSFLSGAGLTQRVSDTFIHSAVAPIVSEFLQSVVLPHAQLFAILIGVGDLAIGVSLALGLFTRAGGAFAIFRAGVNIAIGAGLGMDTIGFNAILAFVGAVAIVTAAGRRFGVDAYLWRRWPDSRLLRYVA